MISWRALSAHLIVLGLAAALALMVWTRKDPRATSQKADVLVWSGSADAVQLITFESEERSVRLEARRDSFGQWFVGTVEKTVTAKPPTPHGRDAGAGEGGAEAGAPSTPPAEKKKETSTFVAVEQGKKLAESLAPLMALRKLGKLDDSRAEEFGLSKPEGTLRVTLDGRQHTLILGGATPGGGDRYAKHGESGEVFAIAGNVAQNLLFAESRLVERELHGFEIAEVKSVKVHRAERVRDLVRLAEKKDGWADASSPTVLDETAGNWMSKLDRLRVTTYLEKPTLPLSPESAIARVEYLGKGKALGFLELYKLPGEGAKASYLVRTEQSRWYAEVLAGAAEQIEQDLASVVK